ncbi:glucosamine-6-phosphate deaminase [Modestobacter sp. VKM Ac-2986]|uniref:glucosamine-6-phosphate deaminase n=1 Tax=Modestobacter sp. VKM Ac-2986 TaxID=3004140 RepID=UPI0022AB5930|nr:glucosamine-6-phosphate deaminase [Modestobacter sp. VKM Ac-2986]MCZ2830596.1 glucosamine-6-phosphate deaminase [Modestobacter sp. VKM Ac-2986]
MEVVLLPTPTDCGRVVADALQAGLARARVRGAPAVLGLATGSSPLLAYRELVRRHAEEGLSFADVEAFLLDEYVGLPAGHPESYREVIRRELTDAVGIDPARVHGPDGAAPDPLAAALAYEERLQAAGPVVVQLLGIGTNGHVGFNEPGSSLSSRTRVKTLTEQTRADNARFFADDVDAVPRHVLTQGLGTILRAEHLVLVATGEQKAAPVAAALEGPLTASVPGSVLQLHPHVTVVVDEAAGSRLALADHHRHALTHKPADQGW